MERSIITLRGLINSLEELPDDFVIFATKDRNWKLDSPAEVVSNTEIDESSAETKGLAYFLEVEIAKEVLVVWAEWRNGRIPTSDERLEAILHYATNDAYL